MYENGSYDPPRRGLKILGGAVLLLALPFALLGSLMPANEYKAWGLNALDCDGPLKIYIVAVPALLIYGVALVINGLRWRRRANLLVAIFCLFICSLLTANIVRAAWEDHVQQEGCRLR